VSILVAETSELASGSTMLRICLSTPLRLSSNSYIRQEEARNAFSGIRSSSVCNANPLPP